MISINATLFIQVINFLVLIWILNLLMFRPLFKIIDERQRVITDTKAKVLKIQEDTEQKTEALEKHLHDARVAAQARKEEMTSEAAVKANAVVEKAQGEAAAHLESINTQVKSEADNARASLGQYTDSIVEMVFLKVMGRKV